MQSDTSYNRYKNCGLTCIYAYSENTKLIIRKIEFN